MRKLPAKVKRTGQHQLSISLSQMHAKELERMRVELGLRSWNQVVGWLITESMVRRLKSREDQQP